MIDATTILLEENNNEGMYGEIKKQRFSFKWLARKIIERQENEKDTIITIVGERRNGKSNWGLKLVRQYIFEQRKRNKNFKWSWKTNFPLTRSQALEIVDEIPDCSFMVYDEAGDIMFRGDTITVLNKKLYKFLLKSGKKKLLTIVILPDIFSLDPKILNLSTLLVAVPYRYKNITSFAFLYGRDPNPFLKDKFGLEKLQRIFSSKKGYFSHMLSSDLGTMYIERGGKKIEIKYPKNLFRLLRSLTLPRFLHMHRFSPVEKSFEDRYIRHVKNKQLLAHLEEESYIKLANYKKLEHQYKTLLYNLYVKQGLSYAQIERLHLDPKTKTYLRSRDSISKIINTFDVPPERQQQGNKLFELDAEVGEDDDE